MDEGIFSSDPPPTNQQVAAMTTVNTLARDIDSLERHIDTYGSVTLKQPDVWGQARLTMIRNEFETEMKKDVTKFTTTLQGTFSASDQAYFMNALALSAAASGTQQVVRPAPTAVANVSTAAGATAPPAGTNIGPQALPNFPDLTGSVQSFGGQSRNGVTLPALLGFGANATIALEPTVVLEQKARYLNALHELRRINEGDDTADSPGYSLNLIRLPVSIFPGKRTDVGYGAEMTLTVTPQLGEELLPMTFRNLVLNDLVDQLGFPAAQFINNPDHAVYFDPKRAADLDELLTSIDEMQLTLYASTEQITHIKELRERASLEALFTRPEWLWLDAYLRDWEEAGRLHIPEIDALRAVRERRENSTALEGAKERADYFTHAREASDYKTPQTPWHRLNDQQRHLHTQTIRPFQTVQVPASKSRRARMPFPPTEIAEVYGDELMFQLVSRIYNVFAGESFAHPYANPNQIVVHLPDIQGYLQEELGGVQKLLQDPSNADLWQFCTPELVHDVRSHAVEPLRLQRQRFEYALQTATQRRSPLITPTVAALAWAYIVESALLTDQLLHDMKEAAAAKGAALPGSGEPQWLDYYLPSPSPEARQAFNQYVSIRWPIHVFALDPVQQQQNIGTTFSGRREMQLALSMGFVNGQISAQDMMQYARRVEFDAQTIDLNGTTVGFSNGENTFGWRYYPRFQTPEIQSGICAFLDTVLIGGPTRNQLMHQRRLEPGMRECDAIVIMPSFVPYVSVDVSTNWFSLTNPRKKDLNAAYAMRLSRQVKEIQTCKSSVCDGHCYRDGDVSRLYAKVQQLETRLPFQTMTVQVPYENTLGGFGMFNTGVTDLAPELTGWYGTPSINPNFNTDLFLVGNHFSVLQTTVIAGGQNLPATTTPPSVELLSRQVLRVTIPGGTITTTYQGETFVDVQVATPYGVTQHLMIPVCENPPTPRTPPAQTAAPAAGVAPVGSNDQTGVANAAAGGAKDAAGGGKDAASGGKDAVGGGKDVAGGGKDVAGGGKDATGGGKDTAGGGKDTAGGGKDAAGGGKDAAGGGNAAGDGAAGAGGKAGGGKTGGDGSGVKKKPAAGTASTFWSAPTNSRSAGLSAPEMEAPMLAVPGRANGGEPVSDSAAMRMPLDWTAGHTALPLSGGQPSQQLTPPPLPPRDEDSAK